MDPDPKDVVNITPIVKKFVAEVFQDDRIFVLS